MSSTCHSNKLLQRDGTSQGQRLLKALLPEYVAVDERKMEDLKAFVLKYAKEIQFYDPTLINAKDGDWEAFFDKEVSPEERTEPHYALFLAFLQLFKIAQDDLNQITRRHLDFYYREVLQLEEKPAEPDQVFIILNLAKHVNQHLVEKGTRLKAGKDGIGKELIYETDRDIVVNPAQVTEIKSLFKDNNGRIYASPIANSADGKGAELESSEKNWKTFGKPTQPWPDHDRDLAEIGFAFASPILFLAEGDREVAIKLSLKDTPVNLTSILANLNLLEAFRVRFSGEKEWIEPLIEDNELLEGEEVPPAVIERILDFLNTAKTWKDIAGVEPQAGPVFDDPSKGYGDQIKDYDIGKTTAIKIIQKRNSLGAAGFTSLDQVREVEGIGKDKIDDLIYSFQNPTNTVLVDAAKKEITIITTITKGQDAIVAYDQEVLLDPFQTQWPVVKITLRTDQDPYLYNILKKFQVKQAEITVKVSEVRELVIQNDQAVLDAGKDFQPFGIRPVKGSNFYIGSREVFSKRLDKLKMHFLWHGLPEDANGFGGHYALYINNSRNNQSFKANAYLLDKKVWTDLETNDGAGDAIPFFSEPDNAAVSSHQAMPIENVADLQSIERDIDLEEFSAYDTDSKKGFLKLELTGTDFGHSDYQASFTKQVLVAIDDNNNPETPMPNEPYTPQIKEVYLNYSSSVQVDLATELSVEDFEDRVEQFFHVEAFGVGEQKTVKPESGKLNLTLFPQFNSEGTLYIGLENFTSGQTLALLFQVAEGSADPDLEPQPVKWDYMSDNQWINFDKFDILSDGTTGLLTSGIVRFDVSKKATVQNTMLTTGLHWLRATVNQQSGAVSDLIGILAQVVTATFKDEENDPDHLKTALPAETISKFKVADAAIDKIKQPFASFDGKVKELPSAFYTRVSERLRHKNRAITIWDYERLVLENFASTYKVKCINHTKYTGSLADYSELSPGHVSVIVISNVRNKNAIDPLRPKTSLITLVNIHDYLATLNPICVDLHVKNPIYEEIQVKTNVKFFDGFDNGFYTKQMEDDIKAFLSPWAFEDASDLTFGGRIHSSMILNRVEELPYVDYVTCFEMYHIVKDPTTDAILTKTKVDEAMATTAVSILGSVGQLGVYGDHQITALETEDCACDDNEVLPAVTIASADECPCDESQQFEM